MECRLCGERLQAHERSICDAKEEQQLEAELHGHSVEHDLEALDSRLSVDEQNKTSHARLLQKQLRIIDSFPAQW